MYFGVTTNLNVGCVRASGELDTREPFVAEAWTFNFREINRPAKTRTITSRRELNLDFGLETKEYFCCGVFRGLARGALLDWKHFGRRKAVKPVERRFFNESKRLRLNDSR